MARTVVHEAPAKPSLRDPIPGAASQPRKPGPLPKIPKTRARRLAAELKEQRRKQKDKIRSILDKNAFYSIYITLCRAVIGEPFQVSRKNELLVSYRRGTPWIVKAEDLEDFLKDHTRLARLTSEELFTEIRNELARPWLKKRPPVRHPVWRDKEGAR